MTAFIEIHTTSGMEELVNVAAIQTVKQMKKCVKLVFIDEEPVEVVESYDDIKELLKRAAGGESVVSRG